MNTTGKSPESLSSPAHKNISLAPSGKSVILIGASHPNEGRAHVTNARWDAVDAKRVQDERAWRVRRSRVAAVLASNCAGSFLRGDGGKRAVHRGEHEV